MRTVGTTLVVSFVLALAATPASARIMMTLSASPPSAGPGQSVTFTATLKSQGGGQPSGTVKFSEVNQTWTGPRCDAQPLTHTAPNYQATCTTNFASAGKHTIDAEYSDSSGFYAAVLDYQIAPVPSSTTLTADNPAPVAGSPFTLTATVSTNGDATAPTGTVRFLDNGTPIQSCANARPGGEVAVGEPAGKPPPVAQCHLTVPQPGAHSFTALFHNDQRYADSQSSPVALQIRPGSGGRLACADQDRVFSPAALAQARTALVCLIDQVRAGYGLGAASETPALDVAAQAKPLVGAPLPRAVVLGDVLGDRTPYAVIASLMADAGDCSAILGASNQVGVGVLATAVIARPPARHAVVWAASPTWTVELASTGPAGGTALGCPHPIPADATGQAAAARYRLPGGASSLTTPFDLSFSQFAVRRHPSLLAVQAYGEAARPVTATVTARLVGGGKALRRRHVVRRLRHQARSVIRIGTLPRGRSPRGTIVVHVSERAPRHESYVYEIGL